MEAFERQIQAAQGYIELGMHEEALEELESLPPAIRNRGDLLELRIIIQMQAKDWTNALETSRNLMQMHPETTAGFIHAAFCLHELGRSEEAKQTLLQGPQILKREPVYHYNLACYECVLGNVESAKVYLKASFDLDNKFREFARNDPDLRILWQE